MKKKIKRLIFKLLPSHVIRYVEKNTHKTLHLTFDDGPHPEYTPQLIALLEKFNVKATFFVIGQHAEKHPELIKLIASKGHNVANHSYKHKNFASLPLKEQLSEIDKTNQLIKTILGIDTVLFRPPGGIWSFPLLWQTFKRGMILMNWSRDSLDCRDLDAKQTITLFEENPVISGDIILFHDDNAKVIDVLTVMITKWEMESFCFVNS